MPDIGQFAGGLATDVHRAPMNRLVGIASDAQFLHLILKGSTLHAKAGSRPVRAGQRTPCFFQDLDDVIALGLPQSGHGSLLGCF